MPKPGQPGGHADHASKIVPGTPFLITQSDTDNITFNGRAVVPRAISFATAGIVSIVNTEDQTVIIPSGALNAGTMHPIQVKRINVADTTATGFVGYY